MNKHRYLNFEKQAMISGINTVNSDLFKVLSSLKASQNSCFIAQFVKVKRSEAKSIASIEENELQAPIFFPVTFQ